MILDALYDIFDKNLWSAFDKYDDVEIYDKSSKDEILLRIKDADAIIVSRVKIGKDEMDASKNLKYIGVTSTGFDNIDISYAKEKKIAVTNVPGYGTDTVAEYAIGMMLAISRKFEYHSENVKNGMWAKDGGYPLSLAFQTELNGKTLGIVGYGRIGARTAEIAKAFKMKVYAYDINKRDDANVKFVELDELIKNSDYVSLHCPLTEDNENLVDERFLKLMKKDAYLINVSRGKLVDEHALAHALNNDLIRGAAVDTVSVEPISDDNPLLTAKNILITPHIAWLTKGAIGRIMQTTVENLDSFIIGEERNRVI